LLATRLRPGQQLQDGKPRQRGDANDEARSNLNLLRRLECSAVAGDIHHDREIRRPHDFMRSVLDSAERKDIEEMGLF